MPDPRNVPRLPIDTIPALRVVPSLPTQTCMEMFLVAGMSHVDIAGSIPASQRANERVVTVAGNSFTFKQPVFIGDLLSFYAHIVHEGRTSLTVNVEVYAQRMGMDADVVKVTEATLTFVATDESRMPRPLPPKSIAA
jgi:acyl-CoA thioesterase YciA